MFWFLRAIDMWMLYLLAAVFGFAYVGCVSLLPVIAGEIFELKSIDAIVGVQMLRVAIGGAIGPVLGGYVFNVTRSYYFAFMLSNICTILALDDSRLYQSIESGKILRWSMKFRQLIKVGGILSYRPRQAGANLNTAPLLS
jgi:MFS family permease